MSKLEPANMNQWIRNSIHDTGRKRGGYYIAKINHVALSSIQEAQPSRVLVTALYLQTGLNTIKWFLSLSTKDTNSSIYKTRTNGNTRTGSGVLDSARFKFYLCLHYTMCGQLTISRDHIMDSQKTDVNLIVNLGSNSLVGITFGQQYRAHPRFTPGDSFSFSDSLPRVSC